MSRTVEKVERDEAYLKKEKKFVKVEEAFIAKKADGTVTDTDREKIRELRQDWRLNHRRAPKNSASPAAIGTAATQGETG